MFLYFLQLVQLPRHSVPLLLLVQGRKASNGEAEYDEQDAAGSNLFVAPVFAVVVAIDGVTHGSGAIIEIVILPEIIREPLLHFL